MSNCFAAWLYHSCYSLVALAVVDNYPLPIEHLHFWKKKKLVGLNEEKYKGQNRFMKLGPRLREPVKAVMEDTRALKKRCVTITR